MSKQDIPSPGQNIGFVSRRCFIGALAAFLLPIQGTSTFAGSKALHSTTSSLTNLDRQEAEKWGVDNLAPRSPHVWVKYEPDMNERFCVNFVTGLATIDILLQDTESCQADQVCYTIQRSLQNLITTNDTHTFARQKTVPPIAHAPSTQDLAVLQNQVQLPSGKAVNQENVAEFTDYIILTRDIRTKRIKGADGIPRQQVSVSFPLRKDHVAWRARLYRPLVHRHAKEYDFDPALIMAMIHTESHFNPLAQSPAPAYGLMQVVPATSGRDATHFLYGQEQLLDADYLFRPENNLKIGTAYLRVLETRYWGAVRSSQSRHYCIIASYNGGPGAVVQVFARDGSRKKAIKRINALSARAVHNRLQKKLLAHETRQYMTKIMSRRRLYI